jgi:uncharacterized membrane protein HdeD (DUF308 family)
MTNDNSKPETTTPEHQDSAEGATSSRTGSPSGQADPSPPTEPNASGASEGEAVGQKVLDEVIPRQDNELASAAAETAQVLSQPEETKKDNPTRAETLSLIQQSTTWSIILGALMMVLGVAAISLPLVTSLALTLWIGRLLVGNSVIKLIYAIQTRQQGSLWLKLLLAGLYLAAGVVLIVNPLEAVLPLTLLLGSFLVTEGVVELLLAVQMRSRSNWIWLLFNALLTLALGVFIWAEWPLDAPWVIGLLVGISFIASGLSRIMLSIAVRSTVRQLIANA